MRKSGGFASALKSKRARLVEAFGISKKRPPPFLRQGRRKAAATQARTGVKTGQYNSKREGQAPPLQGRAGPPFLRQGGPEGGRYAGVAAVAELMVAGMLTDWPS